MTREEAARVLESMRVDYIFHKSNSAIDLAIAALRGPQPDPDTGLVRCRCGGKAGFHYSVIVDNDCYVECGICGGHTRVALSEDKARDAWNTAMGWRVEG